MPLAVENSLAPQRCPELGQFSTATESPRLSCPPPAAGYPQRAAQPAASRVSSMAQEERGAGADDFQLTLIDLADAGRRSAAGRTKDIHVRSVGRWARRQARAIAMAKKMDHQSAEFLLSQTVKLGEEVGELFAEVLGAVRLQRESKSDRYSVDSLRGELADVLICTAILAELLDVDLTHALEEKMATVEERLLGTKSTG